MLNKNQDKFSYLICLLPYLFLPRICLKIAFSENFKREHVSIPRRQIFSH